MSSPRSTLVLEVVTGTRQHGDRYVIHPDQKLLLGRTTLSDLVLDHGTVSRRHAWIWCEDGQWMVEDAGSNPGTYLDDESVSSGRHALPYGSILRLGGFDLRTGEGAPDLPPSIPVGVYPRFAGEAAEKAQRAADAARPPPVRIPPFAGRFVLNEILGRGNQGVVHRAYDNEKRDFVALKILDSIDDNQIERFLAGAGAKATRTGHRFFEHIAWGVEGFTPYIAMELVPGETLTDRLKSRPLTMGQAVTMVKELAYSVGMLHSEDLLHRNIKPDNIRFHEHARDTALLSDIWVDMQRGHRLLYRRELMARSLGYIAPEQARTGYANARCDVYSLAAILYRCVAGCMPVPQHDPDVQYGGLGSSDYGPAQPLIEVRPDAPQALCDLLRSALSMNPEDRPASGFSLQGALAAVETSLGLAKDQVPFPITRTAEGRRAAPPRRGPIDPFRDRLFQAELEELVLARCPAGAARSHVHLTLAAVQRAPSTLPTGCGLCGRGYFGQQVVELRPGAFRAVPATHDPALRSRYDPPPPLADVQRPFVCADCLRTDFRAAHEAFLATLGALTGRDEEPMRPTGPTRRELREGLYTLLQDARPHIAEQVPCSRCSRKWQVLLGAELNLCLDCLAAARAAAETKTRSDAETETERVRTEYARLFVRAEARLAAQGRRTGRTAEKDIQVPPKSSIGDWFYTEITALERAENPPQAEIDRVGTRLASSIEAHVMASLRGDDAKGTGSRFLTVATSGLPGYTDTYLRCVRPSKPVAERLEMAIVVMSELLKVGYRYTHQVEELEWRDATEYFTTFHEIANRLTGN